MTFRPHLRPDGWPTRADISLISDEEKAIQDLIWRIEELGASVALTDAVNFLGKAKDRLADHLEGR